MRNNGKQHSMRNKGKQHSMRNKQTTQYEK